MIDLRRPTAVLLSIVALLASGCSTAPDWRTIELKDASGIPLSAIPSIEIENVRGVVTITVDPRITTPEVTGKVFANEDMTKPVREEAVLASSFTAEVVQTEGRPIVRVRGGPPEDRLHASTVEISVRLAACWGVTVKNAGGAVRMAGVAGPITVENGAGGGPGGMIIVRTGQTMSDAVKLTTTAGDIYYQIPPSSTGAMDVLSLDGPATVRITGGRLTGVIPESSWYRGVLNGGRNPVVLRTGKGMARITVLDNAGTHVPAE